LLHWSTGRASRRAYVPDTTCFYTRLLVAAYCLSAAIRLKDNDAVVAGVEPAVGTGISYAQHGQAHGTLSGRIG
jgi:hypothetical protein